MDSIHSTPGNVQGLQAQQLQTRIITLEQENRRLRHQLAWEDRLFANPHLSPGHKLTLRTAVHTLHKGGWPTPDEVKKVYIPALAEKVGLSPKTTGKMLQLLATTGALTRKTETQTDEIGQRITRVSIGFTDKIKHPDQIQLPKPRNHGGARKQCPSCGSEHLLEERTITCTDCGSVMSRTAKPVNSSSTDGQDDPRFHRADEESDDKHEQEEYQINPTGGQDDRQRKNPSPPPNLSALKTSKKPADNLSAGSEKPPTPPKPSSAILFEQEMKEQGYYPTPCQTRLEPEVGERERLEQIIQLLLDIAGDANEHISMPGGHGKKYTTIHRPLTRRDSEEHLTGTKTFGATLQHTDGTTRALCFDTDDTPTDRVHFQQVQEAAQLLLAQGYKPLLEPSPARRGGHLWLIFSERVNARAAYQAVCETVPVLKDIVEYWPSRGNQKVRLPAGKYVTPALTAWTQVQDAHGNVITISDLLDQQTPALLIPSVESSRNNVEPSQTQKRIHYDIKEEDHKASMPHCSKIPDEYHLRKYGDHSMWVEWPSEQYLIDRFNREHTIDELAVRESNGMVNAGQIGRPERTASVAITPDGQRFTDFGAGARQSNGTPDGGDAFEFYCRLHNLTKSEALRQLGQELSRQASQEILCAARAGEVPSIDVMEMITPTGRNVYNENALRFGHKTLEEHDAAGGLVGFLILEEADQSEESLVERELKEPTEELEEGAPYPPPARPCLVCGQQAWRWRGDRYRCPHPESPKNTSN